MCNFTLFFFDLDTHNPICESIIKSSSSGDVHDVQRLSNWRLLLPFSSIADSAPIDPLD